MRNRQYSVTDIIINKVNWKLRNYIYLLTCNDCRAQYVGESLTPLNKMVNIHRKGKPGCAIDHKMLGYCLQREN